VLAGADPALEGMRAGSAKDVRAAMALLAQLIEQDIEEVEGEGARVKDGVARDRMPSVHDPEMRHGRKSKSQRFDGHKGEVVVEVESGVILNAPGVWRRSSRPKRRCGRHGQAQKKRLRRRTRKRRPQRN
jgi:hypothetical protein